MRTGILCMLLAGPMLVGCNNFLVGQWTLISTNPAEAQARYEVNSVTFNPDARTYSASITREGKPSISAGEFSFNGFQLSFMPKEGEAQMYSAMINSFTNQLKMSRTVPAEGGGSQKVTAVYEKVPMASN